MHPVQLILAGYYAEPCGSTMVTVMDAPIFDLGLLLVCAVLWFFSFWAYNLGRLKAELGCTLPAVFLSGAGLAHAISVFRPVWIGLWVGVSIYFHFELRGVLIRRRRRLHG